MPTNTYRYDNAMLHLEWETLFAAHWAVAELNKAKNQKK